MRFLSLPPQGLGVNRTYRQANCCIDLAFGWKVMADDFSARFKVSGWGGAVVERDRAR